MLPLRLANIGRPAPFSDIPKGLPTSLGWRFAASAKPRGFSTRRAIMPTSGAKMHLEFETCGNDMAAVDLQAMEEAFIPIFLGKVLELEIRSRIS